MIKKYNIINLDILLGDGYGSKDSQWWKDLLSVCEVFDNGAGWFQNNIERVVGDGSEVSFWKFRWWGMSVFVLSTTGFSLIRCKRTI